MLALLKTRVAVYRELARHRTLYILGVVGVVTALIGWGWDSALALATGTVGILLGLAGVFMDTRAFRRDLSEIHLSRTSTWRGLLPPTPYEGYATRSGFSDTYLVAPWRSRCDTSPVGDSWSPDIPVEALPARWEMSRAARPAPLASYAVLRDRMRKGKIVTDDAKVRIVTELAAFDPAQLDRVQVQRTTYFRSILTNDLASFDVHTGDAVSFRGIEPCRDSSDLEGLRLADMGKSRASNHLGVSVLALTSDWVLVVLMQGRRSNRGSRQLVSTGSGSMDWREVQEGKGFMELAFASAIREMREEFTRSIGPVRRAHLLGMARALSRGGKPEVCFLAHLEDTWSQLEARVMPKGRSLIRRSEKPFIASFQRWDLVSPANAIERLRQLREAHEATISASLDLALLLMLDGPLGEEWLET